MPRGPVSLPSADRPHFNAAWTRQTRGSRYLWLVAAFGLLTAACTSGTASPPAASPAPGTPATTPAAASPTPVDDEPPLPPSQLETSLPEGVRDAVLSRFTGDLDEMIKRRLIRVGVSFNRT